MYQYVIFDLDGTLTDSKPGILSSVRYALSQLHLEDPGEKTLEDFIGPPLQVSFERWFGLTGDENANAIRIYREYYEKQGMLENSLYPGIAYLLENLKERGIHLAVASCKPEKYVIPILQHFEVDSFFDAIVGSSEEEGRVTKEEVLSEALSRLKKKFGHSCRPSTTLMVGDRESDIRSAHQMGLSAAGVTFGYAGEGELSGAAPEHLADTCNELLSAITGIKPWLLHSNRPAIFRTIEVLMPLLIYWVIQLGIYNLCYAMALALLHPAGSDLDSLKSGLNAVSAIAVWPYLARCYGKDKPQEMSPTVTGRKNVALSHDWPLILSLSLSLSLGLNIALSFVGLTNASDSFQRTASVQYSLPLPLGLVIYGILIPFTEELLFRGIIQNRIRRYFPVWLAILLDALIFGCYHGNPVQILYAFLMGLALAVVYEYHQLLAAPVIMHIAANLLIYFLSRQVGFYPNGPLLAFSVLLLMISVCIMVLYGRRIQSNWKQKGL